MRRTVTITGNGFVGKGQEEVISLSPDGNRRRVYVPEIVNNKSDNSASVRGALYYQRKTASDVWVDCDSMKLSAVKAGTAVKIKMDSATTKELTEVIAAYREAHRLHGIPNGTFTCEVEVTDLALLRDALGNDEAAAAILQTEDGAAVAALVVQRLAQDDDAVGLAKRFASLSSDALANVSRAARLAEIGEALVAWDQNKDNDSEEFWQKFFTTRPWILAQIFAQPVVFMKDKAYVGGKTYKNAEGQITDYLYKNSLTNNALLIEIKTPGAKLVRAWYRKNTVCLIGDEVTGGVAQVCLQRQNFISEVSALRSKSGEDFHAFNPRCALLVGCVAGLDGAALESFEVFRNTLHDVEVVTFDELFARLEGLIALGNVDVSVALAEADEAALEDDIPF